MIGGNRLISIFIVVILFLTIFPRFPISHVSGDLSNPSVLIKHSPINITNNSQFNSTNGVRFGNGSKNNPYIIENWSIDAYYDDGIWIENTDAYFIIRNCYIYNGNTKNRFRYGISFDKVTNGMAENNRLTNNYIGIKMNNSKGNIIANCTCNSTAAAYNSPIACEYGIFIENSDNNIITNCNCHFIFPLLKPHGDGIHVRYSNNNLISHNTCYSNRYGIFVFGRWMFCNNNTIVNNIWRDNSKKGIEVYYSHLNNIINNTCSKKGDGIYMDHSNFNNIVNNSISSKGNGIYLDSSEFNAIIDNDFSNNQLNGIYLMHSENNTITGTTCNSNTNDGIYLYHSNMNSLLNNNCSNNKFGIRILYSYLNVIKNSTCNFNHDDGIFLLNTNFTTIKNTSMISTGLYLEGPQLSHWNTHNIDINNTVNGKRVYYYKNLNGGITPSGAGQVILANCTNIIVKDQNISDGSMGLELGFSSLNTIVNTTASSNKRYGLYLYSSKNNTIANNTFNTNNYGIYANNRYEEIIFSDTFSTDKGWTGYGGPAQWQRGMAKFGGGGPVIDHSPSSDDYIIGNYIGGNYSNNITQTQWLTSPIINCSGFTDIRFDFHRWLGVDASPIDHCYVAVYDGTYWQGIWVNVAEKIVDYDWIFQQFDIGSFADNNPNFQVRFGLGPTSTLECFAGWNIDDVQVTGYAIQPGFNRIKNNTCNSNTEDGIYLQYSNNNTLENNICLNNKHGLSLFFSSNNNILDKNTCSNNDYGIYCLYSHNNRIANCTYKSNLNNGINLSYSDNNKITNCICRSNLYGISIRISKNNIINNNLFINTNNYFVSSGSANIWDRPKTAGKNIIGGPFLGGNYWSNYVGIDSDGDGLGDTNLPHGPGDFQPLLDVFPPKIMDNTTDIPTTGDQFNFEAIVWDEIILKNVHVEYWFNGGTHTNATMNRIFGDNSNGTYSRSINVLSNALKLYYILSVEDTGGNWNSISVTILNVKDNDAPLVVDHTSSLPTTGDEFTFKARVIDNILVSAVNTEYWLNSGIHMNITPTFSAGYYQADILIPSNATIIHYIISASDNSSNYRVISEVVQNIIDNDEPVITDHTTGVPIIRNNFTFNVSVSDNMNVSRVYLEYWFNNASHQNLTLTSQGDFYNTTKNVPSDVKNICYIFSAVDNSNNWASSGIKILDVTDDEKPKIFDFCDIPTTGDDYTFSFKIIDNIAISIISLEYWFDERTHSNIVLSDTQSYLITVPSDVFILYAIVTAIDISNNVESLEITKPILDNDAPLIEDLSSGDPETGRSFLIECTVIENRKIKDVLIEYWFNKGPHSSPAMDLYNDYHSLKLEVPETATSMHYIITAEDTKNNSIYTNKTLIVNDIISPELYDLTEGVPTTGEDFEIKASSKDNIKIESVSLQYWFDDHEHLQVISTFYNNLKINIPSNAKILHYVLSARDPSGNLRVISKNVNVEDNDPPILNDRISEPTTGDYFEFNAEISDNIKLVSSHLEYWFDDYERTKILFYGSHSLLVPSNAKVLHYTISAVDGNKNAVFVNQDLNVIDNDNPIIEDHSPKNVTTGERFNISAHVKDNILISKVNLNYWVEGEYFEEEMKLSGDNHIKNIQVPIDATELVYIISAVDTSGNIQTLETQLFVTDNDKPMIIDQSSISGADYNLFAVIEDNIEISEVKVDYWYENEKIKNITLQLKNGMYEGTISIPEGARNLYYTISAADTSGNWQRTEKKEIELPKSSSELSKDEPSSHHITLERGGHWVVSAIIFLMILMAIIGHYLYTNRKRR